MLNLNSILVGSENPKKLIAFYKKVLGKDSAWGDGDWGGFEIGNGFLTIGPHSEVKGKNKEPGRILINFETDDVKGEFKRIEVLGAAVVAEPYKPEQEDSMWIATFSDPDGNYFQLMSPMKKSN
jgi:predicted enzyme related to lactoylglutathione lyase